MFSVQFSDRAIDDLRALPRNVQAQVLRKLEQSRGDPARFFKRMVGQKVYKLRVGDYRVLAEIDPAKTSVNVHHVGHRRNVYG